MKYSVTAPNRKLPKNIFLYIIAGICMIILISQVERFIRAGTVLGYHVRTTTNASALVNRNKSGSLVDGRVSGTNSKSLACETFTDKEVSGVLKSDVTRISGFVADRSDPVITSSCVYKVNDTKNGIASVSILLRDTKDDTAAKKTMDTLRSGENIVAVKGLGNEAIFNTSSNQLTQRNGKRLITITTPKTADSKADSKATAVSIMKLGN